MELQEKRIVRYKCPGRSALESAENQVRDGSYWEFLAFARETPYAEIAERIIVDRDGLPAKEGDPYSNPIYLFRTLHETTIGAQTLCRKTEEYFRQKYPDESVDLLSISAGMHDSKLVLIVLLRAYNDSNPSIADLYEFLGERKYKVEEVRKAGLVIPESAVLHYSDREIQAHDEALEKQDQIYADATDEKPFLNSIDHYVKRRLTDLDESRELTYDLLTKDMQVSTILGYRDFIKIFQECMRYVSGVEKDTYYGVIRGTKKREEFDNVMDAYIKKNFIATNMMQYEDQPALMEKLDRALFQLYILQDLIDDPEITDIKIVAPDTIRVRVGGKAYLSNVHFIDAADYIRFINTIAVKNNLDLRLPVQSFTDKNDFQYILRFVITAPYITASGLPIIHIRKIPRRKLMSDDLIRLGMMNETVRDYLIDKGRDKDSMGIVFAGPPGSGKTVALNWFLEDAYEQSAEILVIQENDELFAYRKGVMFEHVVTSPQKGEKPCTLEDLGQLALVAGANVFIIGEAKGAEICSAITLSNSGCRTAMTIHSPSSRQTIDKMADLAMRGYAASYDQAMRQIVSFRTIVYLQDFQIKEISEVVGFDEKSGRPKYKVVYRKEEEN